MLDEEKTRVPRPDRLQSFVERDRVRDRLIANGISALDRDPTHRRRLKENDGIVTCHFRFHGGAEKSKESLSIARPVRGAIEAAAITEKYPALVMRGLSVFEISLNVINSSLRGTANAWIAGTRKTAEIKQ